MPAIWPGWPLLVFVLLQTTAEVRPDLAADLPWTQPQAMEYGGFVFIALALWLLLSWRFSRNGR